jgi:hypothetical protein
LFQLRECIQRTETCRLVTLFFRQLRAESETELLEFYLRQSYSSLMLIGSRASSPVFFRW